NSSPIPTTVLSATASRTSGRKRKQAHENNTSSASINSKLPNATGKDGTGDGAPTDNGPDRPTKVARPTVDSTTVTAPKEKRLRRHVSPQFICYCLMERIINNSDQIPLQIPSSTTQILPRHLPARHNPALLRPLTRPPR